MSGRAAVAEDPVSRVLFLWHILCDAIEQEIIADRFVRNTLENGVIVGDTGLLAACHEQI